jgi:hypothetical protein
VIRQKLFRVHIGISRLLKYSQKSSWLNPVHGIVRLIDSHTSREVGEAD